MPYTIAQDLQVNGTGTFAGNVSVPAGTTDSHVINKLQFDTAINDIRNRDDSKPSVRATIDLDTAEPLFGTYETNQTVVLSPGDRVLAVSRAAPDANSGPWIVSAGAWTRADDGAITSQSNWRVEQGDDSGIAYIVTTTGTITIGTTPFMIVPIAAAATLVGDSLGSTEIVSDEIRVKLNTGNTIHLAISAAGVSVDAQSALDYLSRVLPSGIDNIAAVATANVDILTAPATIDGVTISYLPVNSIGRPTFGSDHILLTNQTVPTENGLYVANDDGGAYLLDVNRNGVYHVKGGTLCKGETWLLNALTPTSPVRLSAPTYFQTIPSGIAATHTITHNKRTTRPQVKLFDTVTNEEIYAQPSNISFNAFDLVLSALTNAVQIVVNITPDT